MQNISKLQLGFSYDYVDKGENKKVIYTHEREYNGGVFMEYVVNFTFDDEASVLWSSFFVTLVAKK